MKTDKPKCAVRGILHGGRAVCGYVTSVNHRCGAADYCEHQVCSKCGGSAVEYFKDGSIHPCDACAAKPSNDIIREFIKTKRDQLEDIYK